MADGFDLTGKTVLITGASGVLGRHFALKLVGAGARIAACGRRVSKLDELVETIGRQGGDAAAFSMDVTRLESIAEGVRAAEERLGPIDILINNSGLGRRRSAVETTEADYDLLMTTNTKGAFFVAQEVGRRMIAHGRGGSIINISSIAGVRPMEMLTVYCMSKAALSHMTRVMAVEWAKHDIRVNAIAPGYIETEENLAFFETEYGKAFLQRFLRRRVGVPQHLDGALMMLATAAGDFITGQTIVVDDGYTQVL